MSSDTGWEEVVRIPAPGRHIAQLCADEEFLGRAFAAFVESGLRAGEAVFVIVTPIHWQVVERHLAPRVDVRNAQLREQLIVRDAHETLVSLLAGGGLDRDRFQSLAVPMIDAAIDAGYRRVRVCGEMVDLLRQIDLEATIRLEGFWNEQMRVRDLSLLCGYSVDPFESAVHGGLLQHVTATHSHLIPVEDYARLDRAVTRAYTDVFGGGGDAEALRLAFLKHYPRPSASMPDAAAAILALREFIPDSADRLLERVRRHYALGTAHSS
jgi:hypothetical protein